MFSQRNLQGEENLYTKTVVRVIRSGTAVAALPNTAKRFSPNPFALNVAARGCGGSGPYANSIEGSCGVEKGRGCAAEGGS